MGSYILRDGIENKIGGNKMKNNHYVVTFENGRTVFASCFNEEEAEILAKAVMIKNGLTREIKSIRKTTNISDMADMDFVA